MYSAFFNTGLVALAGGVFYVTTMLSLLLHELAHATVLHGYRIQVCRITVGSGPKFFSCGKVVFRSCPFGGECLFSSNEPLSPTVKGIVALAGPLTNLLLALGAFLLLLTQHRASYLTVTGAALLYINAIFFFANAVAVAETDGFIFWTYLSQKFSGMELSKQMKWRLNAGGMLGAVITMTFLVEFELHRATF